MRPIAPDAANSRTASGGAAEGPSCSQLRQAVDAAGEIVFMTNHTGVMTFVNREFERVYGFSAAEVVGRSTPRILKSGRRPNADYLLFWQQLLRGDVVRGEFENRSKAGAIIHVEATVSPIFDEHGTSIGFLAVQRNVTERKQAEKALRESEARYSLLAEASRDEIFIVDRTGRLEYLNANAAGRLGGQPEEFVGRSLSDCFPPETVSHQHRELERVISTRASSHSEIPVRFGDSEAWFTTWLVPMVAEDGQVRKVLGVARDVTNQHRLAELLERQNRLLGVVINAAPIGISVLSGDNF